MVTTDTTRSGYVPVLDGVRGMAILLVIVCHTLGLYKAIGGQYSSGLQKLTFYVFGSGWMGVDLFFVLSGYLITGVLLNSLNDRYFFKNFYMRRVLRIFPVYYAYLIIIFIVMPNFVPLLKDQLAGYFALHYVYLQNIFPYYSGLPEFLTSHLWSLAVEEHFYLVWPFIVFFVRDRRILLIGLGVTLSAILCRYYLYYWSGMRVGAITSYVYRLTFCRTDSLMLGALLAYSVRDAVISAVIKRYNSLMLLIFGLLSLVVIYKSYVDDLPQNVNKVVGGVGYTLFALFFTCLIARLVIEKNNVLLESIFNNYFMRLMGKYSYAMYVIHVPIIAVIYSNFFQGAVISPWVPAKLFIIVFILTMAGSVAIYHLYEKHFLKLKRYFEDIPRSDRSNAAVATTVAAALEWE